MPLAPNTERLTVRIGDRSRPRVNRGSVAMVRYGPYGVVSLIAAVILILLLLQLLGVIAIF